MSKIGRCVTTNPSQAVPLPRIVPTRVPCRPQVSPRRNRRCSPPVRNGHTQRALPASRSLDASHRDSANRASSLTASPVVTELSLSARRIRLSYRARPTASPTPRALIPSAWSRFSARVLYRACSTRVLLHADREAEHSKLGLCFLRFNPQSGDHFYHFFLLSTSSVIT